MNPLKEIFNEYNFVDHTDDVREDSAFLMLKGSEKHVSSINAANPKFTIGQLNIGFLDSNFVQIKGLDTNFIKWIDECYEINQKKFNNFFVTGTNGKSSALSILSQILSNQKINHASMGTLGSFINNIKIHNQRLTTETPVFIRNFQKKCIKNNVKNILYEASSVGIDQNRLEGLSVDHLSFSNITHDHLDYHENFENYLEAKLKIVRKCTNTFTYWKDTDHKKKIQENFFGKNSFTISLKDISSDIYIDVHHISPEGIIEFTSHTPWGRVNANVLLYAEYNLINLFLSLPYLINCGLKLCDFQKALENLKVPLGRLNKFMMKDKTIYVDYAHTPDGLDKLLYSIMMLEKKKINIVFGCGGERDIEKRTMMGNIADSYCEKIYITNDNPRSEDPLAIFQMIKNGIKASKTFFIEDRGEAIKKSIADLQKNEILIIAGKGHENFQIVSEEKYIFSDIEAVKKCLK